MTRNDYLIYNFTLTIGTSMTHVSSPRIDIFLKHSIKKCSNIVSNLVIQLIVIGDHVFLLACFIIMGLSKTMLFKQHKVRENKDL